MNDEACGDTGTAGLVLTPMGDKRRSMSVRGAAAAGSTAQLAKAGEFPPVFGVQTMKQAPQAFTAMVEVVELAVVLVLQRQLWRVAAPSVVADPGLVLASATPVGPGPDVLDGCGVLQDQSDQQASDLR